MPTATFMTSTRDDGVIVLEGELDLSAAGELDDVLGGAAAPVRLDMSLVTFIDSSGLHALLRRHSSSGSRIVVVASSPPVRRLFELTGVSGMLLQP